MFNSPNLANYNPYELVFGRMPKIHLDHKTDPDIKISGTFADYHALLGQRLKYLQDTLQQFKSKHLVMVNKNCTDFKYNRFSVYNFTLNKPVKNKFKKGYYKICRTFSYL